MEFKKNSQCFYSLISSDKNSMILLMTAVAIFATVI